MPQRKSGVKELRKNRTNRLRNLDFKTELKKTVKKFTAAVTANNKDEAASTLKTVYKKFDKAAKNNLIHKNTSSRRKAHYTKLLNQIGS